MHDVQDLEMFFCFDRLLDTRTTDCVQVIYRRRISAMHIVCDKKMVTARLVCVCVTRKDEEEKKRESVEKKRIHPTHTHTERQTGRREGERERGRKERERARGEASNRIRNEQVKRGMLKPCACMQRGNSCILLCIKTAV